MSDELTLEELRGIPLDPDEQKKAEQSSLLPAGNYHTVPELSSKRYVAGPETKNPGRQMVRFFGMVTNTKDLDVKVDPDNAESETHTFPARTLNGRVGFFISWEPRYRDDGRADGMTLRWIELKKAYARAVQATPEDLAEDPDLIYNVVEYATKYSLGLRLGRGEEENIVFRIFYTEGVPG